MVFGWGKKEDVESNTVVEEKEIEIHFTEIEKILDEMKDLRQKTLIAEINIFRNKMEPEKNQVLDIVNSLEKDNLKINEMDPHLQGLVKRGKKEVISTIQNNSDEFVLINNYEDVKNFQSQSSRMLKKNGDVLGRHSSVIHIFAKKYAKKLKNYLKIIEEYNQDVKKLIEQFNQFENKSKDIIDSKNKVKSSNVYKVNVSSSYSINTRPLARLTAVSIPSANLFPSSELIIILSKLIGLINKKVIF